jgi:hypothetical protein
LDPHAAPPNVARRSAATMACSCVCASAQNTSAIASAVYVKRITRTGPRRSVNDPHSGVLESPTMTDSAKSNVEKLVEKWRTLCRYMTNNERVSPLPMQPMNVQR